MGIPLFRTGNVSVSDLALGVIWKFGHYLYAGSDGGPGGPTGSGLLVRIPIQADGSAGNADLFATGLGANDGLEVGLDGTIYFGDAYNSDVRAFSPDGTRRLLIASRDQLGDPLDNATSLKFDSPAANGTYAPRPVLEVTSPTLRPLSARPTYPLFSTSGHVNP